MKYYLKYFEWKWLFLLERKFLIAFGLQNGELRAFYYLCIIKKGNFVNIMHFWLVLSCIWSDNYWLGDGEINMKLQGVYSCFSCVSGMHVIKANLIACQRNLSKKDKRKSMYMYSDTYVFEITVYAYSFSH